MDTAPELELQQEVQRFATQFTARITQATETLEGSRRRDVRDEALRKNLLYVASAMEIATGPVAEVNLVDMIVFVRLAHAVLERHWIPDLYGQEGADLAEVFERSEADLSAVADKALGGRQRADLDDVVATWLAENPDQFRVEGIRFSDFSAAAGERALQVKGFLASVKTATRAANQALLLSERVLFLVNRMPSLWRLQARLGAREMLGDVLAQLRGVGYAALLGGTALIAWRLGGATTRRRRRALRLRRR